MKAHLHIISLKNCVLWEEKRTEWKGSTSFIRNCCFSPHLLSQGMLALVLTCIDRLNIYNSVAHFAGIAREESGMAWKEILNLLYKLLGKCTEPSPGKISKGGLHGISKGQTKIVI